MYKNCPTVRFGKQTFDSGATRIKRVNTLQDVVYKKYIYEINIAGSSTAGGIRIFPIYQSKKSNKIK